MNLSESVIMPREDFMELSIAAWDRNPTPVTERIATTVQTTIVLAGLAAACTAGAWGWAKAMDWLEKQNYERKIALADHIDDIQK